MTFFRPLRRIGLRVLAPLAAAAALLTACGGGSSQVQAFVPARLLVLGDETGAIVDDGSHDGFKYGLNDRTGTTAGKCLVLPTPAQQVAAHYGFVFAACNPNAVEAKAFSLAQPGAQADASTTGLKSQFDAIAGLGANDIVLVSIGTNDMIAAYQQFRAGTMTEEQAMAAAEAAGDAAAQVVNAILTTGARALVVTAPNLGLSPFAVAEEAAHPGAQALLSKLAGGTKDRSGGFNSLLRRSIDNKRFDGRNYGLVLADDILATMDRYPTSYLAAPANKTDALCATATLPQACLIVNDTDGVAPDTSVRANTHLWATDRLVGPVAHLQIGTQAVSRAANNPF